MIFFVLIFFLLLEFFVITNSLFWLAVILFFSSFVFFRRSTENLKNFLFLFYPLISLFFSVIFLSWLKLDFSGKQIYVFIITFLFSFLLWVYHKNIKKIKEKILKFLPVFSCFFVGIWFFYSGILKYFFWKEIILFLITLIFFKGIKKLYFKKEFEEKENNFIELSLSLILLEFAWVLSFLPINFLNLSFLWTIGFYLSQEFFIMIYQKKYNKKEIILKISISLFLSLFILFFSTWRII